MFISISFSEVWDISLYVIEILYLLISLSVVIFMVMENRNPIRTMAWILVLILLPLAGLILYLYFGQNFRKVKLFSRKGIVDFDRIDYLTQGQINELSKPGSLSMLKPKESKKVNIIRLLLNNSKALLSARNKIKILNNGEETFRVIIEDLEQAKHHIHIEFYIIEDDEIGNRIKDLLIRKARQGVEIRIIYDDVGSWKLNKKYLKSLSDEGIEVYAFMPVKFPFFTSRVNYRNHRKIIVVDGKVGFVGGINIADRYIKGIHNLGIWRDTHLRLEGESVYDLQMVFMIDWYFTSKKVMDEKAYLKKFAADEEHLVQITASGPDSDYETIMQAYFSAITTATEYIYIVSPYFLPTESILFALKTVSLSGVDVRIILPARSDSPMTYWSSLSYIQELLESGIKVYFYEKGFSHSKIMIVDDVFASVGSANMDYRSFSQNFEIMALIYDEKVALELKNYFLTDLESSRRILNDDWSNRKFSDKIKSSFFRLFSPLL